MDLVPSICTYPCVIRVRVESHKERFFTETDTDTATHTPTDIETLTDTHRVHLQINGLFYSFATHAFMNAGQSINLQRFQ